MKHDAAAAMPEREATGLNASLFAEIREATGQPFVTSVWRMLAHSPADLQSTWDATRPFIRPRETASILRSITPELAHSLRAPDSPMAQRVLIAYSRANSATMAGLLAALTGTTSTHPASPPIRAMPELPPLREREELPSWLRHHVDVLDRAGTRRSAPLLHATVWRHLASAAPISTLAISQHVSRIPRPKIEATARLVRMRLARAADSWVESRRSAIQHGLEPYLRGYAEDVHTTARVIAVSTLALGLLGKRVGRAS